MLVRFKAPKWMTIISPPATVQEELDFPDLVSKSIDAQNGEPKNGYLNGMQTDRHLNKLSNREAPKTDQGFLRLD